MDGLQGNPNYRNFGTLPKNAPKDNQDKWEVPIYL
jgi:hypothetical protein